MHGHATGRVLATHRYVRSVTISTCATRVGHVHVTCTVQHHHSVPLVHVPLVLSDVATASRRSCNTYRVWQTRAQMPGSCVHRDVKTNSSSLRRERGVVRSRCVTIQQQTQLRELSTPSGAAAPSGLLEVGRGGGD